MMSMSEAAIVSKGNRAVKRMMSPTSETATTKGTNSSLISSIVTASTSACTHETGALHTDLSHPEYDFPRKHHHNHHKCRVRMEQLQNSLQEALRENEGLLHDAEMLIERYEALERKHDAAIRAKNKKMEQLHKELKSLHCKLALQKQNFDAERKALHEEIEACRIEIAKLQEGPPSKALSTDFNETHHKEQGNKPVENPPKECPTPTETSQESQQSRKDQSSGGSGFLYGTTRLDIDLGAKSCTKSRDDCLRRTWHGGATERTRLGLDILGVDVKTLFRRAKSGNAAVSALSAGRKQPRVLIKDKAHNVPPQMSISQYQDFTDNKKENSSQNALSSSSEGLRIEKKLGRGRRLSLNIQLQNPSRFIEDCKRPTPPQITSKSLHGGKQTSCEMANMNRLVEEAKKASCIIQPSFSFTHKDEPRTVLANAKEIAAFLDLSHNSRSLRNAQAPVTPLVFSIFHGKHENLLPAHASQDLDCMSSNTSDSEMDDDIGSSIATAIRREGGSPVLLFDYGSSIASSSSSCQKQIPDTTACSTKLEQLECQVPFDITIHRCTADLDEDDEWSDDDDEDEPMVPSTVMDRLRYKVTSAAAVSANQQAQEADAKGLGLTLIGEWRRGVTSRSAVWNGALGA